MKTYLFIGGTADGSRINAPGNPVFKIAVAPGVPMFFQGGVADMGFTAKEETYHLQIARSGESIYLFEGLQPSQILELLIAGYSKQPEKS